MKRVSLLEVLSFVWGYWRQLPFRLELTGVAVFAAVFAEILIPDRAAELMTAVEHFARGEGAIEPA